MNKFAKFFDKRIISIILVAIAVISFTIVGPHFEKSSSYPKTMETLENNDNNIAKLAGAATITSTLITAIPDDTATPVAEEIADFTTYFLIILTALYFEKYLLVITAMIAYRIIIPIACVIALIGIWSNDFDKKKLGAKMIVFAIFLNLLIPGSAFVSRYVDSRYQDNIQETISLSEETQQIFDNIDDADSITDKISILFNDTSDYLKTVSNSFISSIAIMVVSSCIIPLLTLLIFYYLMKKLFGINIKSPSYYYKLLFEQQQEKKATE